MPKKRMAGTRGELESFTFDGAKLGLALTSKTFERDSVETREEFTEN